MEHSKKNLESVLKKSVIPFTICTMISIGMYIDHNYKVRIVKAPEYDVTHATWAGYYIDIHKRTEFEKEYREILEK